MKHAIGVILTAILLTSDCRIAIAQSQEAQQLLLNVEKLARLKSILSKMKQGYQVISQGYDKVKALSQGNFNVHKTFLDGLLQVSPIVRNYRKAAGIIQTQQSILKEYNLGKISFSSSALFSTGERQYLDKVGGNLLQQSLKQLEEFAMVITSGEMRMSDGERLEAIDRIYSTMQDQLHFLRQFTNSNRLMAAGRKMEQYDINNARKLHGVNP
jgi:cell fate (sporulation/competence/biofilm development) regulator YmcA (YheA/YmcA/DUF963 family)